MEELIPPVCGECGASMELRESYRFTNKNGSPKKFWGCTRYPECRGTHSAHQNSGKPMGIPADKETKAWRIKAHAAFDPYVRKWFQSRPEGYRFLQNVMGLTAEQAHIAKFNIEQCQKLIKLIENSERMYQEENREELSK